MAGFVKIGILDQVTVEGATSDPLGVFDAAKYTVQLIVQGSPSALHVWLDGSVDGNNWAVFSNAMESTGIFVTEADPSYQYVRLRVGTLTGGTSPSVSANLVVV